jgi:putative ABC transport system permease protein
MKWNLTLNIEAYPGLMADAQDEVITTLRRVRQLRAGVDNNFSLTTAEMMKGLFDKITGAAAMVVILIAAVSLFVAGIGIMNVMFVSVKERTKEIGIRKACGATSQSILIQFALEAVMLSTFGGIIGLGLIGLLVLVLGNALSFGLIFPTWLILLGLVFSFAVGVVFGIVPAYRASKMKVVDALRYE